MADRFDYFITTDMTADFPKDIEADYGSFGIIPMTYFVDNVLYDGVNNKFLDPMEFYARMDGGSMPQTSLITTEAAKEFFRPILKDGFDLFHVSFSSALSGTFQSVSKAAQELRAEFPERKIVVFDSKSASGGEGLLVYYLLEKRKSGASFEELSAYADEIMPHVIHLFLVDDLFHLYRGGRVSRGAAVLGTAMQIKPVMRVSDDGRLEVTNKVFGRKLGLKLMIDKMAEKMQGFENKKIFVHFGSQKQDALWIASKIKERTGFSDIHIEHIGPVIGTHTGSGVMALFFLGDKR